MRRVAGLAVRAADAALGTWRAPGALQRLGVEAAEARGLFPAFSRGFSADGAAPEAQPAAADPPQPRMKLQLVKDDRPLRPWEVPREPKVVELPKSALSLEKRERQQGSRRSGLLAVKCGMTCEWTEWGERLPLTVLWIDDCQVVQVKTDAKEGYTAVQVGAGSKKGKQLTAPERGHFRHAAVPYKRELCEFRVTEDALMPVGTLLNAAHFVAGQKVDVAGITRGHGFAGGMKRHGFQGQGASHGNSVSHRAIGSTGNRQDPGRVFKGKKMPGRMGSDRRTVQNCVVYKVDPQRNLLYVRGQVPGHAGNFVEVKDAIRAAAQLDAPFPTFVGAPADLPPPSVAPGGDKDPFEKVFTHISQAG